MAASPEAIAPGVYRVDAIRLRYVVSVFLLANDDGWMLVDTGLESSVRRIREAVHALGSGPEDLVRVFITHQHYDHTGGLSRLLEWAPHAEVGAPEHEAEIVSGRRGYDPSSNPIFRYLIRNARPPAVPVGKVLREGDLVSGFRVVSTPGHTPGHVSLLRDADGVLLAADAFGCLPRRIRVGIRKALCTDPPLARRSARKLLEESFSTVVMSHGPVLRSGAKETLSEVVERCRY